MIIYTDLDFMTIEDIQKETGWPPEWIGLKFALPYIRRLKGDLVGIEVGTERGEGAYYLLDNISTIKTLITVDPYVEYQNWNGTVTQEAQNKFQEIAKTNLSKFNDRAIMTKSYDETKTLLNQKLIDSVDFVYMDGDSSFDGSLLAFQQYYSLLRNGGLFLGHNYQLDSVRDALNQFRQENKVRIPINRLENFAWFWYKT